jgi:lipopolysaccharide transport system ATP-binding protein
MSSVAIRAEQLGKRYRIGTEPGAGYRTLREQIGRALRAPGNLLRRTRERSADAAHIWALDGVSFEVGAGETVGIIGRNGAGKSTLLKVLSRITEPSMGRAEITGRVCSLLEVGTGFHPELTGRENAYLNGAILGMRRAEIARKFDEIVAFAEIEKFIDTPVKFYSSGMYLRLAFAVAAHLEPEILIVDEVLAVGDARFQKKCLSKMQDVSQAGRTVLFVSHSMPAITRLCQRAILLDHGSVIADGPVHQVVTTYLSSDTGTAAAREWPADRAPGSEIVRLRAVRVRDGQGAVVEAADIRQPVRVEMEYDVLRPGHVLLPNLMFFNEEGIHVFTAVDIDPEWRKRPRPAGRWTSATVVPGNMLAEGTLFVSAAMLTLDPDVSQFHEREAVAFQVIDSLTGDSARGDYYGFMPGMMRPKLAWTTRYEPPAEERP